MKPKILITLFALISLCSCQKTIQKAQLDMLQQAVSEGSWYVFSYIDGGTDITASFSNYVFKFNTNNTVDATLNTTVTKGNWKGDISTVTIFCDFLTAPAPLSKLNGTWNLKDYYTDYVKAEQNSGGVVKQLYLKKMP